MSGLCGVVDFTGALIESKVLRAMATVSRGLGPDGIWTAQAAGAAFCHLALHATPESITERQPLRSPDGMVWLVADVRLDNRAELISQVAAHDAADPGDAALVLAAYRRWGVDCAEHLLGDFAFVLWDAREQRLLCVRDPLGIRTLCYARSGPLVVFASEAQQILQHPRVPRRLDEATLADYLAETWENPERTFFHNVRRVPPAQRLVCTAAGERLERYWTIDPEHRIVYRDDREYTAHFLEVFRRSVADRLRAPKGPVAVAMSGGLDSTSVAAVASGASPDLFACSFAFKTLAECDEQEYVQAAAGALQIETELVDTERFWMFGDDEAFRPRLERPSFAWESAFRDMLERVQARKVRILLTGHGGDDLLAGSILTYSDRLLAGDLSVLLETGRHAVRRGREGFRILYRYFGEPLLPVAIDKGLHRLLARNTHNEIPDWIRPEFAARTGLHQRLPSTYRPARSRRGLAADVRSHHPLLHLGPILPVVRQQRQPLRDRGAPSVLRPAGGGISPRHAAATKITTWLLQAIPPPFDGWPAAGEGAAAHQQNGVHGISRSWASPS